MRIEDTDEMILEHISSTIRESKRVREEYKLKNLGPKFEKVQDLKRESDKRIRYINDKKRIKEGYEESIINLEVDVLTNKMDKVKGKKMIRKISDMVGEVSKEIKRLEKELWLFQNSNDWVDWLDQMYLRN